MPTSCPGGECGFERRGTCVRFTKRRAVATPELDYPGIVTERHFAVDCPLPGSRRFRSATLRGASRDVVSGGGVVAPALPSRLARVGKRRETAPSFYVNFQGKKRVFLHCLIYFKIADGYP
jgi:hypothetical protein